ncbi:MAG: hypothetical protein HY270_12920, partial [Deltaproteobacteria bacterium]|nr:hypothetical protein [Deltaproteobacteria bacterium]
ASSEYLFIDGRPTAPIVLCIKPILPAVNAGVVECNGGLDFSIKLSVDHNIGQIGVDGFEAPQCLSACTTLSCGKIESANQVCAAGLIGEQCRSDADCNSTATSTDGVCGLGRLCTAGKYGDPCSTNADCDNNPGDGRCAPQPKCTEGTKGASCRADVDCDTTADAADGVCGNPDPEPGVCNSGTEAGQVGGDSGAGAVTLAPAAGLTGLPVQLSLESALPCGDEGQPAASPFALTSGIARTVIKNFSNADKVCSDGSMCKQDSDCDTAAGGPGKGKCGTTLTYDAKGENFSCSQWTKSDGPGCLVLGAPTLNTSPMGGDLVTAFKFCGH